MDGLLPIVGAGLTVAVLVLLAMRLGFRGTPQLAGADEARQIAATLAGGFRPADLVLDRDRCGALLADPQGRVALVAPFGAHFIARELAANAVVEPHGDQLIITLDGHPHRLDLGDDAQAWHVRIAQARGQA